jgi:ATP-dependent RNA helicase DHX29
MRVQWYDDDDEQDDPYNPNDLSAQIDESNEEEENVYSKRTRLAIRRMDENKINYEVMTTLLEYIAMQANERQSAETDIPETGAILIFLPGMPEIRKMHDILASHHVFSDEKKYILIPLHSLISTENQEKVFDVPPAGMRKIILSTNIAETGVTIEDVTIVVDTGMVKEVR